MRAAKQEGHASVKKITPHSFEVVDIVELEYELLQLLPHTTSMQKTSIFRQLASNDADCFMMGHQAQVFAYVDAHCIAECQCSVSNI